MPNRSGVIVGVYNAVIGAFVAIVDERMPDAPSNVCELTPSDLRYLSTLPTIEVAAEARRLGGLT